MKSLKTTITTFYLLTAITIGAVMVIAQQKPPLPPNLKKLQAETKAFSKSALVERINEAAKLAEAADEKKQLQGILLLLAKSIEMQDGKYSAIFTENEKEIMGIVTLSVPKTTGEEKSKENR